MIPLFKPYMPKEVDEPLLETLHSGYIGQGKKVEEYEKKFAEYIGSPYVVSTNSCTMALTIALRLADVDAMSNVLTTAMTCLSYNSRVLLPDGSTEALGKIVDQKLMIDVVTLNITSGELELKPIKNWLRFSAKSVEWYKIWLKEGRNSKDGLTGKRGIWVTGDHKVLTRRGYIRVDGLDATDQIATRHRAMTDAQRELFDGMMLGDAYLRYEGRGDARFAVRHGINQKDWVLLKQDALNGIPFTPTYRPAYKHSGPSLGFESLKSIEFTREYKRWYSATGTKVVPNDLVLTPLAMAAWYMDDGSLTNDNAVFCTEGFDIESFWRLFWKMTDMGFHPRAVQHRAYHYRLSLTKQDTQNLFSIISAHIPSNLRYKLCGDDLAPFDKQLWELGRAREAYASFDMLKGERPPRNHHPENVYCIEVEDNHNFITADMVVSNCTATNSPILSLGADPIFCDVDPNTGLIDPWDVGQQVLFNSRAIIAVDWGGNPVNVDELSYTAERYHMKLVIDAAHSLGAEYEDGSKVGTKGDLVCFSTQAIKTITTIDGGMLVCRSEEDYKRAKLLRWFGIDRESDTAQSNIDVDITEWGYKGHMNDVNATIGIVQLDHIDKLVSAQRTNALYYDVHLSRKYVGSASALSAYWLYTILLPEPELVPRFKEYMTGAGVMVDNVHRRNDEYQLFSAYNRSLPGLDKFASHMICLPVHWGLTASDRAHVVEAANQFAKDEL